MAQAVPQDDDELTGEIAKLKEVKRWVEEIRYYEKEATPWTAAGKKIIKRYKDTREPNQQRVPRFNILWSNIQTLLPALYSRTPKPDIERRFRDKDDLGRISSTVLERAISFFINDHFNEAIRQSVRDRLLPGRGTVWVRYEPHFKDSEITGTQEVEDEGYQITDDVESYNGGAPDANASDEDDKNEPAQEIADEYVCYDYVHWEDFGHTFGRTWEEIEACWRKVYLTREQLVERFGKEIGNKITLDYTPHDIKDNKVEVVEKKATIYEIWDKCTKRALWVHKDYVVGLLDEKDDPLELEDFFPFPRPLYATLANDDMLPVPDYREYQDQANELDDLTSRIGAITKAVKVAGIYDASAEGVGRLLSEGIENQLVPVSQHAALAEKGGLAGVMQLMPMQEILQTLLGLYEARDKVKADLYEITGIADIIRGATDANETATAQQIKSQFGTLRLTAAQDDVQRFVRDLVKIGTQIIAEHFSIETIKRISGVKLLTEQEKQLVQMRQQILQQFAQQQKAQQPQPGQPPQQQAPQQQLPQMPPLPEWLTKVEPDDMEELMENPTWEEVERLLRDEITMSYRIDIETDSTIKFDQDAERDARVQFLTASGQFLDSAMKNTNPDLNPLLAKMLMFGVRGFKIGKELEGAFELAIHKLEKDAANPDQQKPDPEMAKVKGQMAIEQQKMQNEMQLDQAKLEIEKQKAQVDSQREDHRLQMQAQVDAHQGQVDAEVNKQNAMLDGEIKLKIAKLQSETELAVAQIRAKAALKQTAMGKDPMKSKDGSLDEDIQLDDGPTMADLMKDVITQLQQTLTGMQQSHQQVAQAHNNLAQAVSQPKRVMRDENGDIVGVQ